MGKKLKRSNNAMLGGVAAGVAEYFGIDVTLTRIIWALLICSGFGLLIYLVCWLIMPK
ncbi:MAG: PspC domain-containing protein [Paludibacteraceae bacterium]|nr:PspC domain-containing protein [Paludibacteraceae bacterium]MEE1542026.1 PspC domain-containing protein [Paludibacteraceae bacterium]